MTKLLFIIAVTIGLVLWFKRMGRRDVKPPRDKTGAAESEDMARCRVCGVHLPRSEAITSRGRVYCCDEHRRRDQG